MLILEKNQFKKRKKITDYLLRQGFESDLIYIEINQIMIGEEPK